MLLFLFFAVDTALMQGVKKFFNMQKVFYRVPSSFCVNPCKTYRPLSNVCFYFTFVTGRRETCGSLRSFSILWEGGKI